jgi:hypothetical protein
MIRWTIVRRFASVALAAALTACSEPTGPAPAPAARSLFGDETNASLVQCPSDGSLTGSALLGVLGGELSVGGMRLVIPPDALPLFGLSLVTLTVPPSKYVEIEVQVNGLPHFQFAQPVTVVLDYSRCTRSDIDRAPLSVWNIDPLTKALLEDMGGVDDKSARTVTFTTDHFSGYAIAQ